MCVGDVRFDVALMKRFATDCRRFEGDAPAGAILGIELKKELSPASRRQGEAEFYTFSMCSNFPL
jgi:hypothetical protein